MMEADSDVSELFNVGSKLEGMDSKEVEKLYQEFLTTSQDKGDAQANVNWNSVKPTPGRCIKTRNVKNKGKAFINICTSSTIPAPLNISEEELIKMLDNLDDPDQIVDYKIPMSVGAPHAEFDNKGNGCTAYDIIISPNFLHTILNSKIFLGFFMSVVFEALQAKYNVELDRNWIMLKTKKFLGNLDEQNVRKKSLIQEVGSSSKPLISEVKDQTKKPEFNIVGEPENDPNYLVAEIKLPGITAAKSVILDIGEDRLVLCTRPKLFDLNIFFPFNLIQEDCGAQFNVDSQILTVTMPVAKAVKS